MFRHKPPGPSFVLLSWALHASGADLLALTKAGLRGSVRFSYRDEGHAFVHSGCDCMKSVLYARTIVHMVISITIKSSNLILGVVLNKWKILGKSVFFSKLLNLWSGRGMEWISPAPTWVLQKCRLQFSLAGHTQPCPSSLDLCVIQACFLFSD